MSALFTLFLILACMLGEAFFAGMEIGVVSVHKMRLRHFLREGSVRARLLQDFLDHPEKLLGVTLVGTNLSVVTASVLAAGLSTRLIGAWGEVLSSIVMTVLLLVFCEYLPKSWFQSRPFERAGRFVRALHFAGRILYPISVTVTRITDWMVPGPVRSGVKPHPQVTREELKVLAREEETHGVLSPGERMMIHRVFELSGKQAFQIMTPRARMITLSARATLGDLRSAARKTGHLRFPIVDPETQSFVGVVNIYDALSDRTQTDDQPLTPFTRQPLFIDRHLSIIRILPIQRMARQPLALVTDDEHQVIGMITTADILEEIVGAQ